MCRLHYVKHWNVVLQKHIIHEYLQLKLSIYFAINDVHGIMMLDNRNMFANDAQKHLKKSKYPTIQHNISKILIIKGLDGYLKKLYT